MDRHASEHEHDGDRGGPAIDRAAAGPQPSPAAAAVLRLQQTAGNRAVGRVLARETPGAPVSLSMRTPPDPGWSFDPVRPGALDLSIKPFPPPEASAAIGDWVEANRSSIASRKRAGSLTMESLVAEIRRAVPKADIALDFQIEFVVNSRLGSDAPPYRRAGAGPRAVSIPGLQEKLAALLAGGGGGGGKVIVEKDGSYLKVGLSGVEGRVKAAGPGTDQTTVTVGPGGVELKTEDPHATTTISVGWGDSVGFKTKVAGGTIFEAAIGKEGDAWAKWSVALSIPLVGREVIEARPPVDEIVDSVDKGYRAATGAIGLISRGAKPTDVAVKAHFKDVKPAVEKLGKAVEERKGPNVTFKLGAEGAPERLPGGETRQKTFVGASLVVEF